MLRKLFLKLEKIECEERCSLSGSSQESKELHQARYDFASNYSQNKKVLDVATGNGYGAYNLATKGKAKMVIGVDRSQQAISFASQEYKHPNLFFQKGLAEKMDFEDDSFDLVVSMETIEHLKNTQLFLKEIKRVLRPNGLFIVSTPNKNATLRGAIISKPLNPYHFREFTKNKFKKILQQYFSNLEWFGQKIIEKKNLFYFLKKILGMVSSNNGFKDESEVRVLPKKKNKGVGIFVVVCSRFESISKF